MRKIIALMLTLVFVFALSACNNKGTAEKQNDKASAVQSGKKQDGNPDGSFYQDTSSDGIITRDRAIELALTHAGLTNADVYELEAELDRERVGVYWEVDFKSGALEYSYDINAETQEIIKLEKERD